jgi:hypothetical protein
MVEMVGHPQTKGRDNRGKTNFDLNYRASPRLYFVRSTEAISMGVPRFAGEVSRKMVPSVIIDPGPVSGRMDPTGRPLGIAQTAV